MLMKSQDPKADPSFGLGDAVHAIAQPVAKGIDLVIHSNLTGCNACDERRARLNALAPKVNPVWAIKKLLGLD
jgi:hypothetical protein